MKFRLKRAAINVHTAEGVLSGLQTEWSEILLPKGTILELEEVKEEVENIKYYQAGEKIFAGAVCTLRVDNKLYLARKEEKGGRIKIEYIGDTKIIINDESCKDHGTVEKPWPQEADIYFFVSTWNGLVGVESCSWNNNTVDIQRKASNLILKYEGEAQKAADYIKKVLANKEWEKSNIPYTHYNGIGKSVMLGGNKYVENK